MGVIHKLKPEIIEFIIAEKRANKTISCRGLEKTVYNRFNIKVSKSSINQIFKVSGLSLPIGRRSRKGRLPELALATPPAVEIAPPEPLIKEQPPQEPPQEKPLIPEPVAPLESFTRVISLEPQSLECAGAGAVFLKAADCLLETSKQIMGIINKKTGWPQGTIAKKTECAIFQNLSPEQWLLPLLGYAVEGSVTDSYLIDLQGVSGLGADLWYVISKSFQEVRGFKITLTDGRQLFLDGQARSVWQVQHIPHAFSTTINNAVSYINSCFSHDSPFTLMMCQNEGHECFSFLQALEGNGAYLSQVSLYDNKLKDLEGVRPDQGKRYHWLMALPTTQLLGMGRVEKLGNFKPYTFAPLQKSFFIAEASVAISKHVANKEVTIRSCALKRTQEARPQFYILTNMSADRVGIEQLAQMYLSRWPNLEEGMRDFQHKLEFFAYTGGDPGVSLRERFGVTKEFAHAINVLFAEYQKHLDIVVRQSFFPSTYENIDFSTMKKRFYDLKAFIKHSPNETVVTFLPYQGYPYTADLAFACARVNERNVMVDENTRLYLAVST
ncbi:MAG: hypothetical protein KBA46_01170 [Candidatus Omnitrophica bacterium]|nr:hypothetical protein [Candidatus Omnitrophota bacterium]